MSFIFLHYTSSSLSRSNVCLTHIYSYGGIYERGPREYTLDDFYTLQLDKLDRYVCLKESAVLVPPEGEEVSSSSGDDDDDDDDESGDDNREERGNSGEEIVSGRESEGESESVAVSVAKTKGKEKAKEGTKAVVEEDEKKEVGPEPVVEVTDASKKEQEESELESTSKPQTEAFMGVAKDVTRSPEEMISTPLPGETLAAFYARSRERSSFYNPSVPSVNFFRADGAWVNVGDHWSAKARETNDDKGKQARRAGFNMAQERYSSSLSLSSQSVEIVHTSFLFSFVCR